MKYYYVVGSSASKSLSPLIFNYWFKKYNINAKYSYIEVDNKNFDKEIVSKINNKKTFGLNITIPYKKKIMKHLDAVNKHSKKIRAVNCVTIGKKNKGINTDWVGYLKLIKKEKINKEKKIIIMGYGGAAQAVFYSLHVSGFKNIIVFNRTKRAIRFDGVSKYTKNYLLIDKHLEEAGLVINTTPTNPIKKKQAKLIKKETILSDIVYKPKNTIFLRGFKQNKKIYGISMLLEQAIPCFKHWFGFDPKIDKALIRKIDNKIK